MLAAGDLKRILYCPATYQNIEKTIANYYFKEISLGNTKISRIGNLLIIENGRMLIYFRNGEFLDAGFTEEIPGCNVSQKRIIELSSTLFKIDSLEDSSVEFTLFRAKNDTKKLGYFFLCKNNKTENILRLLFKNAKCLEFKEEFYLSVFNFLTETSRD